MGRDRVGLDTAKLEKATYGTFVFTITLLLGLPIVGVRALLLAGLALALYAYSEFRKPHFLAIECEKQVQANMVFAARDIYINLKTTGRVRDAVSSVAYGGYGYLSTIFCEALLEMEAGKGDMLAFSGASRKSNLPHFQRLLAILGQPDANLVLALQRFILDLKRERIRVLQAYELKSEIHSRLLPLVLIGAGAFLMVVSVMGFYFSSKLPIFQIILLNYIILPYIFIFMLFDLKKNNPRI